MDDTNFSKTELRSRLKKHISKALLLLSSVLTLSLIGSLTFNHQSGGIVLIIGQLTVDSQNCNNCSRVAKLMENTSCKTIEKGCCSLRLCHGYAELTTESWTLELMKNDIDALASIGCFSAQHNLSCGLMYNKSILMFDKPECLSICKLL